MPGSQKVARYAVTSSADLPLRSISSGGKRISSQASAVAGIWLRAWLGLSIRAMLTVVRQASSAGTG